VGQAGKCPEKEAGDMRNAVGEGDKYRNTGEDAVRRSQPQATGEPDAVKVARPVRRGAVGKGLRNEYLAGCLPYREGGRRNWVLKHRLSCARLPAHLKPGVRHIKIFTVHWRLVMLDVDDWYLLPVQENDRELLTNLWTNDEVRKYLGGVRSIESLNDELNNMMEGRKGSYFTIHDKSTHIGIGMISITDYHDGQQKELSYHLLPEYWGKGVAYKCVITMLEYAKNELQLSQIVAETQSENLRSRRLLQKVGMEEEREIERFGEKQTVYKMTLS